MNARSGRCMRLSLRLATKPASHHARTLSGSSGRGVDGFRRTLRGGIGESGRDVARKERHGNREQRRLPAGLRSSRRPVQSGRQGSQNDSFARFLNGLKQRTSVASASRRDALPATPQQPKQPRFSLKPSDITSFFDEMESHQQDTESVLQQQQQRQQQRQKNNTASSDDAPSSGRSSSVPAIDVLPRRPVSDLFPVKERTRGPTAYEEKAYNEYMDIVERIVDKEQYANRAKKLQMSEHELQTVKDWLFAEEPAVPTSLASLEKAMNEGLAQEEMMAVRDTLRTDLNSQKEAFLQSQNWTDKQHHIAVSALIQVGHICAKTASGVPLEVAWQKVKEIGCIMNKDMLNNYLFVSSTFSRLPLATFGQSASKGTSILDMLGVPAATTESPNKSSSGTTNSGSSDTDKLSSSTTPKYVDVASETAICQDSLYEPTEQSMSIRVRLLVSQGRARDAEVLLDSSSRGEDDVLRLRTYAPIFDSYLNTGDVLSAMKLYVKMRRSEGVFLQPENYVQLVASLAENGYFRESGPNIDGITELGYSASSGPELMDGLLKEMAEDVLEISAAAAKRLYNALQKGFAGDDCAQAMAPLNMLEPLRVCNDPADPGQLIASRVILDESTGKCPRSGARLRLIELDDTHKRQLQKGLLTLASETYTERYNKKDDVAERSLAEFGKWLDSREGDPFTAIIDGANVAYYMQNYDQGRFNFFQIKFIVDAMERMGEKVLVVIPEKYMNKWFNIIKTTGYMRQHVAEPEDEIRRDLYKSGKLYVVPAGMLDDYYWMYASVADQTIARGGDNMFVSPNNQEGRWPGIRPMLLSNDKMRDHKLGLLEPRLFRRWHSNYIVNFTFSPFVGDSNRGDSGIGFTTADFFSREIQGNAVEGVNATTWHIPVSDWEDHETFCIRIPRRSEGGNDDNK